jgi:hypothetical protein
MFTLAPEGAWIVTDTLATTLDGEPYLLVSKCFTAPHLELAVAFTGIANLGNEWTQWVQSRVLARDIDMLDVHAPDALRKMHGELDLPNEETSTVYHIGFSSSKNVYVGYAYRSTEDFESEEMIPGFRVKPDPPSGTGWEPPETPEEIIGLAEAIRANEDTKPPEERRIYIGGELVMIQLHSNAILSTKIHKFADFEEVWLAMNDRLNRDY